MGKKSSFDVDKMVAFDYCHRVVFGWWVPNDLLAHSAGWRAFCDAIASVIPQIDRVTELGGPMQGNSNRVVYSSLWVLVVLTMPFFIWTKFKHLSLYGFDPKLKSILWWKAIVVPLFSIAIALNGFFLYSFDPSLRIIHFGIVNRFGAALVAPVLAFLAGVIAFCIFLLIWGLLTGRIQLLSGASVYLHKLTTVFLSCDPLTSRLHQTKGEGDWL